MSASAQVDIMHGAGFVSASEAATAIGAANVGTVHRMLKQKKLTGQRLGFYWYVSAESLIAAYAGTPVAERVEKLLKETGVKVKNGGGRVAKSR